MVVFTLSGDELLSFNRMVVINVVINGFNKIGLIRPVKEASVNKIM